MSTPSKYFWLVGLAVLLAPCCAIAHDIGASNGTFWVRPTGIDAELYMSLSSGALLIANDGELVAITPATYPDFTDRLQAAGAGLFTLTAADGTTLNPDSVTVSMTEQMDVLYNLHYPLPAAMPGTLTIHAGYIDKMTEGHLGDIYVMNTIGDRLGFGEVHTGAQDIVAHLPAANSLATANLKANPAPAAPTAPAAAVIQTQQPAPWYLWAFLGGSAVLIALVGMRGILRKTLDSKSSRGT